MDKSIRIVGCGKKSHEPVTVEENSVDVGDSVVSFEFDEDQPGILRATERCDSYYEEDLTPADVDKLIEGLKNLRSKMVTDEDDVSDAEPGNGEW